MFVGEGSGDNKVYKYHTKLYVSVGDDGNTNVIFGSANLTTDAKEKHYEVLIRLVINDRDGSKNPVYDYFNAHIFNEDKTVKRYNTIDRIEEPDEDEENSIINDMVSYRMDKYALLRGETDKKFVWGRFRNDSLVESWDCKSREGDGIGSITNWIRNDDVEVYICKENYYEYAGKTIVCNGVENKYFTYNEYNTLSEKNLKKKRNKYYNASYSLGRDSKTESVKKNRRKNNSRENKQYINYPCVCKYLMDKAKTNENNINVGEELRKVFDRRMLESDADNEVVRWTMNYLRSFEGKTDFAKATVDRCFRFF